MCLPKCITYSPKYTVANTVGASQDLMNFEEVTIEAPEYDTDKILEVLDGIHIYSFNPDSPDDATLTAWTTKDVEGFVYGDSEYE